jgi:hypothetical protein
MFASIRRYHVGPGQRDEVVRRVDEGWADELRRLRGAQSYLVVASAADELISVTVCEDETTLGLAVEKSAEWVGGHLMDLDVSMLDERRGEVVSRLGG